MVDFRNIYNTLFSSYKSSKKIIVIESDDWGALRQDSKLSYSKLFSKDIPVNLDPYERFDGLETESDLNHLLEVLNEIKLATGKKVKITQNFVMNNPDFDGIGENNYEHYKNISLKQSYLKYSEKDLLPLISDGIDEGFLNPQFHGREHLNVPLWLKALQHGDRNLQIAFDYYNFSVPSSNPIRGKNNATRAFDSVDPTEVDFYRNSVREGLEDFYRNFNYHSKTMICPSYTWSLDIEKVAVENGVRAFQGIRNQFEPTPSTNRKIIKHYTGEKNRDLIYLVRNLFFEPSIYERFDLDSFMRRLNFLFMINAPVIIGTHRLNFIGRIDERNRVENLKAFKALILHIIKKHPDCIFLSSEELLQFIDKKA